MGELISVIIPIYNIQNCLHKCINSVIAQTYKNLEIILVDDGSTDDSGMVCDQYKNIDKRIKVIHKENGGLSDARNVGIAAATGKFYSFIDGDDYIEVDMLETMYKAILLNKAEISICNIKRVYEDGEIESFYEPTDKIEVLEGVERFQTLNQPSVCNKLFSAKLFESARFLKGKFYEDTFIYHEILYLAKSVVMTGKVGYWYRERRESILGYGRYTERYFDFIEAVYSRMTFLMSKNIQPYGYEACLSLYAAVSDAVKNIRKTCENKEKFEKAYLQYEKAYQYLMDNKKIGMKQKIRLIILRYVPYLHKKLY